jgi:glycosyltransferase involved in cell wall biosynthesis
VDGDRHDYALANLPALAPGMKEPQVKLSVVMPVYNERATLREVIERVLALPLEIELICVDDGSRDGSVEILKELEGKYPQLRLFLQPRNMGKGAALRRAISEATGDFVVVQDATLNMTLQIFINSLSPFARVKQMSSMVRAFWEARRTGSCISGTGWAIRCSLSPRIV